MTTNPFPSLPLAGWRHTRDTITTYAQIVGKVRRAMMPKQKHWWHISLRIGATGLTTTPIPANGFVYEITLDFIHHRLLIQTNKGDEREFPLVGQSAANFCTKLIDELGALNITPDIDHTLFQDETLGTYDETAVSTMWQVFTQIDAAFKSFKGSIRGETSPVQLWPHHFDMAMLWITGRLVDGQDPENEEYADEQVNFGFSTGDSIIPDAYFYATAYPTPDDLVKRPLPDPAYWYTQGFTGAILMYEAVASADNPTSTLRQFLDAAREAASKSLGLT